MPQEPQPSRRIQLGWRFAVLAGLAAGLALSPLSGGPWGGAGQLRLFLAAGILLAALLGAPAWRRRSAAIGLVAALAGLGLGSARIAAIDSGALIARPGMHVELRGFALGPPRILHGEGRIELQTGSGRLAVIGPGWAMRGLGPGDGVVVTGSFAETPVWLEGLLRRHGIASVLRAERVRAGGARRGGAAGWIDGLRRRAEDAVGRGIPGREAELARGFVLGQDDGIDPVTANDFRRSGLTHLLAVSGQNVVLLCLLAWPFLAVARLTFRTRLITLIGLIAIYVAVTGAGPSIQRAGIMGAAGLVAGLAGRPSSRWYALLLAVTGTLALNPRSSGDPGWQLSFAAVIGLALMAHRLGRLFSGAGPNHAEVAHPVRRAVADAAAATIAATLATAPLIALHFGAVPLASLPANLLAAPAVAPAMWLGMLSGALGQIGWIPVEPLNQMNALCLAYIEQVAHWCGAPSWSLAGVRVGGAPGLIPLYAALAAGALVLRAGERRAGLGLGLGSWSGGARGPAFGSGPPSGIGARPAALAAAGLVVCVVLLFRGAGGGPARPAPDGFFHVRFLDVGQGDSILLQPPGADPILVDAGPPDGSAARDLDSIGVRRLAAVVVTHDQSDHAGGVPEVLDRFRVGRLVYASASARLLSYAQGDGVQRLRVAEGSELRSGGLRLDILWPPRAMEGLPGGDPNERAIVAVARWRHLSVLLTADAETEAVPFAPEPVDILKVAHHGSDDTGLAHLLDLAVPDLAVISVGSGNSYGHPTGGTVAELADHEVPLLRTDRDGEVDVSADARSWWVDG